MAQLGPQFTDNAEGAPAPDVIRVLFEGACIPDKDTGHPGVPMIYSEKALQLHGELSEELAREIAAHRPVNIYFDNDLTMCPFAVNPDKTRMDPDCFRGLIRLAAFSNVTATSLTGRDAMTAKDTLLTPGYEVRDSRGNLLNGKGNRILRFPIIGSHGLERMGLNDHIDIYPFPQPVLRYIEEFKHRTLLLKHQYPELFIEDRKIGAVGVNAAMIGCNARRSNALGDAKRRLATYEGEVEGVTFKLCKEGKYEYELRAEFGKGFGIRHFGASPDALTWFFGDSYGIKIDDGQVKKGTDIDAVLTVKDKAIFPRGRTGMVMSGRVDPPPVDADHAPDLVYANPRLLGLWLNHVADRAEALEFAPRPERSHAPG